MYYACITLVCVYAIAFLLFGIKVVDSSLHVNPRSWWSIADERPPACMTIFSKSRKNRSRQLASFFIYQIFYSSLNELITFFLGIIIHYSTRLYYVFAQLESRSYNHKKWNRQIPCSFLTHLIWSVSIESGFIDWPSDNWLTFNGGSK